MFTTTTTTANSSTTSSTTPFRADTPQTPPQQAAPQLYSIDQQPPQSIIGNAPASPRSQLRAAASDGDGKAIKRLLAGDKPDLNAPDPATGMTALMLAARENHDDVVFLLIKGVQGQDIHCPNEHGQSALTVAAAYGNADVVKLLLGKGAQQAHKNAALASAAAAGQADMVRLLLDEGVDVDYALAAGSTVLHRAAEQGFLAVVNVLVAAKAGIDRPNKHGDTALMLAAGKGHADVVQYLLDQGAQTGQVNSEGQDAMWAALAANQLQAARLLHRHAMSVSGRHAPPAWAADQAGDSRCLAPARAWRVRIRRASRPLIWRATLVIPCWRRSCRRARRAK